MRLYAAVADNPAGPYRHIGEPLLPLEGFTIDAHAFRDPADGAWYLFFAKDFFDEPVGTALAVVRLADNMTSVIGPVHTVLRASADWQVFARNRDAYGKTWATWSTLEGPTVLLRDERYYLLYSGGCWEGNGYGMGFAVADKVLGPYVEPSNLPVARVLRAANGVIGPGHASVMQPPESTRDMLVYHAWDHGMHARQMCMDPIEWTAEGPMCDGPTAGSRVLA
jgi:GH43 family beta-xylosidase